MNVPRIAIAAVLIVAGALLPGAVKVPTAPASAVGMTHEGFRESRVTIPRGGTVTFYNDSGFLHVLGPGDDGRFASEPGSAQLGTRGAALSETGDTYVAGPWNTPGTYHITCSLHPEMNITIVVTG